MREIEPVYVEGMISDFNGQLGKGTYLVFILMMPLFYTLFLVGEKEKNYGKKVMRTILAAVLFSSVILLGSYIILLGNFGVGSLQKLRFPIVTLMSTIQFEGNFLRRMDALMLAVWFFTLYALLNLHLHYGVGMLANICAKEGKKFKIWQVILVGGLVFSVAWWMHDTPGIDRLFLQYYSYVAVPFMVIVPGFLLLVRRKK